MPLSAFDYDLFMDTYLPLLHFTGLHHRIIPAKTSYKTFQHSNPMALKFECRQKLIRDPAILALYMSKFGKSLSIESKQILGAFSKRITAKFIIYKLFTNRAIFISPEGTFYVVHDLQDPFGSMVDELPCLVEATILPFQHRIMYDGFLQPYNVNFGPNIRKSLLEQYRLAKEEGRIIKSLT
jgi:hypothetical protein